MAGYRGTHKSRIAMAVYNFCLACSKAMLRAPSRTAPSQSSPRTAGRSRMKTLCPDFYHCYGFDTV
jgi:hypothetical protein